jgi:hypothetical protein
VNLNVILQLEMKPPKMRLNKTHLFPPEIRKKKTTGDLRLEKAFRILEQAGDSDESQAFGIFVGKKLRTYSPLQEVESSMRSATSFLMLTEDVTSHKNNMLNKLNRLLWCQNVNTPLFLIHLPHP